MSIRLKVQSSDSRYVNSHVLKNASNVVYSIVMDRYFQLGQILDANGATVAQCAGNGSPVVLMQALRNYMTDNLGFVFFDPADRFDQTAVSTSAPSTNTLTPSATPTSGAITLRYNSISASSAIQYNASSADVQAALRTIAGLSDVTVSGTMATHFTITNGGILSPLTYSTTGNTLKIDGQSKVAFSAVPDSGVFQLTYGGNATANINFNATAAQVQAALRLVSGLSAVTVSGNFTSGFTTTFNGLTSPTAITVTTNTLLIGVTAVTPTVTIPVAYAAVNIVVA